MRYNSESLEIKVAISGNSLLSKDIKISLGLLITVRKLHALFRENHYLCKQSNSRIDHFTVSCLVAWPLNESEAVIDLVLIGTSMLFLC